MTDASGAIHEETFRINAIACDIHRALKPAALFQHLTEAAGHHAALLGVGYDAMVARNLLWVHARMRVRFHASPHAGDTVTIRTWPKTIQRRLRYIRDFEVLDASGQPLAAATSAWLVIDAATHRISPAASVSFDLPAVPDRRGLDDPLDRLDVPADGEERLRVRAGYSALDVLGHVNNSRYVEWLCDAFPLDLLTDHTLDWMQINYTHEVRAGEEVSIRVNPVTHDTGLWAVEGLNLTHGIRAFEAYVRWRD